MRPSPNACCKEQEPLAFGWLSAGKQHRSPWLLSRTEELICSQKCRFPWQGHVWQFKAESFVDKTAALEVSKCSKRPVQLSTQSRKYLAPLWLWEIWMLSAHPFWLALPLPLLSRWCYTFFQPSTARHRERFGLLVSHKVISFHNAWFLFFSPAEIKVFPYQSLCSYSSEQFVSFSSGNLQICHPLRIRWMITSPLPGAQTTLALCLAVLCSSNLDHHYLLWGNASMTPLVYPVAPGGKNHQSQIFLFSWEDELQ